MNYDDICQMYHNTLVFYRNKPVYVSSVLHSNKVQLWDLLQQKEKVVEFDERHFKSPNRRIGMVQIAGGCVYIERVPMRKYWNGYHKNNIRVNYVGNHPNGDSAIRHSKELQHVAIGRALMNDYPSYQEALEQSKQTGNLTAFDKQFATDGYTIYYKDKRVGDVNQLTMEPAFLSEYMYLISIFPKVSK